MKKVAFYTLGCKVNQYETEAMLELFEKDGYEQVNSEEYADVYVINTCTVTHMSDRKSRQYIRRVKKKNPDAIIAVVGCYSQVSPEEILDIEEVNLVMGTNDRRKIVEEIRRIDASKKVSTVDDIMKVKAFEEIEISQTNGKTRAFMKIQDGCDRFCTYCIIPYARGRVRSRDIDSIVDEVKKLAKNGYKEVVLTGIHVASYGKDLKDKDIKLLDVIKQINEIDAIERIRLSSVEPILFTDEFVNEVLKMEKVCPHYHLSLQSGCDETLKRMNRRYTTEEYKTIVDRLRDKIPNVAITTDVIVGFPGETNEEFKQTYNFLKDIELSQMHIFKYSPRKGTPAATMENQIDPQMKHFRSEQLLNLSKENFSKFATKFIGSELEVLFEQNIEGNKFEGLTSNYIRVVVESDKNIQGQILKVKINDVKNEYVEGILL
ncbi:MULTISPECIES: tRNA (N(6)-L-threonylcarbamoyladenosine(37)-C(2))-methylthiotransferase MtaB [unclassified Clostridioides]|uniref:tRNA (N(6)-L-threonylcarbamoyladenosine(37)-C(2))- methylthiotransferase MtaB n=1 Tax=unclassified Clostridioides TaxID=2635829 RepID=UPI001D11EEEF|nr:tRNA (N(6)-L-threonylcarbamoyladenosine(37)-C(2))-methylthiotransferase MtaB [Clostridioides sp. ES-S-0123-01]MCC0675560.1 tRNA (N(6)-L-threonylcarbamoyladenosine(37)-C(2))-methylthiotransferase MtaB [Clostridioides sp. ES-W-0018-02]MCC0680179.1 tRNA (N(6)-L-threonylcarbamoyladenosine(37)-C(2))-methylthiotransferase MtaB [Clostridioides sp. ES-S-0005-03]MCC0701774.1 tRNA (N(6)-L-threonylcarbamoyladenosine(37)-C(2))-methylthiotransferase MtaB [Clostridioides sp. ES-S-0049-02]MCC0707637.1 tRNA